MIIINNATVQDMIDAIDKPAIFINTQYTILAVNQAYRATYESEVIVNHSKCFEISHNHATPCEQQVRIVQLKRVWTRKNQVMSCIYIIPIWVKRIVIF